MKLQFWICLWIAIPIISIAALVFIQYLWKIPPLTYVISLFIGLFNIIFMASTMTSAIQNNKYIGGEYVMCNHLVEERKTRVFRGSFKHVYEKRCLDAALYIYTENGWDFVNKVESMEGL